MTGETQTRASVTEDRLLGGKVILRQPADGFRAAIDPVLLAAAVPARSGQSAVEFGSGTGAASLCLAHRVAGLSVSGFEIDAELVALSVDNARANAVDDRVSFMPADITAPGFSAGTPVDHVFANPPFWMSGSARPAATPQRDRSVRLSGGPIEAWVAAAARVLKPKGQATFIFPAGQVDKLMAALTARFGGIVLFPLWPREGQPAKRILVSARKDGRGPSIVAAGLTLHQADGRFTPAADVILRQGRAVDLGAVALGDRS